jgi:hypothetical protein
MLTLATAWAVSNVRRSCTVSTFSRGKAAIYVCGRQLGTTSLPRVKQQSSSTEELWTGLRLARRGHGYWASSARISQGCDTSFGGNGTHEFRKGSARQSATLRDCCEFGCAGGSGHKLALGSAAQLNSTSGCVTAHCAFVRLDEIGRAAHRLRSWQLFGAPLIAT